MFRNQRLNDLIASVGPLLPEVDGILLRGDGEWILRLPDLDVDLELDSDHQRLMLSIDLNTVDAAEKAELLMRLLHYACLWRDTGGVFFALNAELRPVIMLPLFVPELTTRLLATVIAGLVEKARAWRLVIESLELPDQSTLPPNKISL